MEIHSNSDDFTRAYFDSLLFELRQLDCLLPDLHTELFGHTFDTPIMMAALSHVKYGGASGMVEMAKGAAACNAVNWSGMGSREELEAICAVNPRTVKIVKPYADDGEVLWRLDFAREQGCMAVGVDIDHAAGHDGTGDVIFGDKMFYKSAKQIEKYVQAAKIPFVVKGVLSVTDAKKCLDAGVSAIVVSHHHNLMPYSVPPLALLPEIAAAVKGKMYIFVDCCVTSGYDAAKALALGADAVCAGRVMIPGIQREGANGVVKELHRMNNELRQVLGKTGCATPGALEASLLHRL